MVQPLIEKQQSDKLRILNIQNRAFWKGMAARDKQIEDEGARVISQAEVGKLGLDSLKSMAAKGGRAIKADSLTRAISAIVETNPNISQKSLLKWLVGCNSLRFLDAGEHEVTGIQQVTQISFERRNGQEITVPVARLKDRLSRAKLKLRSKRG
jgi:hypothetical protein